MRRAGCLLAALAVSLAGVFVFTGPKAQAQPGPSAGRLIAGGLLNPRGIVVGPDGMLYVAEAGEGGDATIVVEGQTFNIGHTGRVSKIDPSTGARTTVADGLPSNAHPMFGTTGPADVAFLGGQLYYVQTHGGAAWGFPDEPTGLYKVNADGSVTLVADIGAFNVANPVSDVTSGRQLDIEPGGNPYRMTVRGGAFYVVDGNQNQVMKITPDGTITRLTEFPGHPVSTGITYDPDGGPFYVAMLGREPFSPEQGKVVSVGATTGDVHEIAAGYSALTDVGIGPGGQLYALQFAEQAPPGGPPLAPFTGKVLRVSGGTMTPVVGGFTFATAMTFSGAKLYVVNHGLSVIAPGEVWAIDDIRTVPPVPAPAPSPMASPQPTATPAGPILPPVTGDGGGIAGSGLPVWALAALWMMLATALAGARLRARGR
jgi:hypothetical protein